jgi:hypothetical protein
VGGHDGHESRFVCLVVAVGLVLAACGSGSKTALVAPTTVATTTTSPADRCAATATSALSAVGAFWAASRTHRYPTTFAALADTTPPILSLPLNGLRVTARQLIGNGWTLTMHGGGTIIPTFTCS